MSSPKIDAAEIGTRLKTILDYVHDCTRRVGKGEIMDLQGLDNNVIVLCDAIASLPKKDAQAYEDQMSVLIEELEHLAQSMKTQHQKFTSTGAR